MHIEHRIALERVLAITGWEKNAEAVIDSCRARQRRHQLADAALSVVEKRRVTLERRARGRDREVIFAARPVNGPVSNQEWFEIKERLRRFDCELPATIFSTNRPRFEIPLPVVLRSKHG